MLSVIVGLISDSAVTPPPPQQRPDLARNRLDHPLVAAIRPIYVVPLTWPIGCARPRRSREDRSRVQRAPPPIEQRVAAASPRRRRPAVLLAAASTRTPSLRRPFGL